MKAIVVPSIVGALILYLAALYFRYEPIPNADPDPDVIVLWDRFNSEVCFALSPKFANASDIACTQSELQALVANQGGK